MLNAIDQICNFKNGSDFKDWFYDVLNNSKEIDFDKNLIVSFIGFILFYKSDNTGKATSKIPKLIDIKKKRFKDFIYWVECIEDNYNEYYFTSLINSELNQKLIIKTLEKHDLLERSETITIIKEYRDILHRKLWLHHRSSRMKRFMR